MLAYYVYSTSDDKMNINMAFCNSKIKNARKDVQEIVGEKLKEIINLSTSDLEEFEGGIDLLREKLL